MLGGTFLRESGLDEGTDPADTAALAAAGEPPSCPAVALGESSPGLPEARTAQDRAAAQPEAPATRTDASTAQPGHGPVPGPDSAAPPPRTLYLAQHALLDQAPPRTLYLAQHALLDQVPSLGADVGTPEQCALSRGGHGRPRRNAWIGPAGTVSDLHTDADDNVLCQMTGWKRVLLIAPAASASLGARPGMMKNTSGIDPERLDTRLRLAEAGVAVEEALLGPGEALFIPRGWWHHVRALTPSASVSYWWC